MSDRYRVIEWDTEVSVYDTHRDMVLVSFWNGHDGQYHPSPVESARAEAERLNNHQRTPHRH